MPRSPNSTKGISPKPKERSVSASRSFTTLFTLSKHPEVSDLSLIKRTQLGETEAFSVLVCKYQDRLYRHLQRRVKDRETAKDLTQEVWLKAFRGIKGFRCSSSFYAWVYRIAENVIIDHFRQQKHQQVIEPLHALSEQNITDTAPCPSVSVLRAELREQLRAAICQLTPLRRRVFLLVKPAAPLRRQCPLEPTAHHLAPSATSIRRISEI